MNANLERVLRVLKKRDLIDSTPAVEIARLSGLSRKTISQSKNEIQEYLKIAPLASEKDEAIVDRKIIDTYIDKAIHSTKKSKHYYSNILGAIAGYVLRHETDLINHVQNIDKVINIGKAYINLVTQIQARKGNEGTPIHSKSKDAEYLLKENNKVGFVDDLFKRADNYSTGMFSKSWSLKDKAEEINRIISEKMIELIKKNNNLPFEWVTDTDTHIPPLICADKSVTSPLPPELLSVDLDIGRLGTLSVPSIFQVLNSASPSLDPNSISVSLSNLANIDESLGRTYNVFSRLRSSERKELGFINYDISGGIQIISFSILYHHPTDPELFNRFPMLFSYGWEPEYKKNLRNQIAKDLRISVDEVKRLLTAYANGSKRDAEGSLELEQFQRESDALRREVTSVTAQYEPEILETAIKQSKHEFPEDLDWKSTEPEEPELAKKKSSVFFFIWTHYEKKIRDAMLTVVDDGIPLHDAIYSKHDLPCKDFEEAILEQTGFEVKISH